MEYMSCPEAAEKWGISERRVQILCKENRIPGVSKIGYMWLIPKSAVKPFDKRIKSNGLEILFQRVIIQLLYLTEVRRHGGILILFLTKHQNITMKMLKVSRQVPYLMTII